MKSTVVLDTGDVEEDGDPCILTKDKDQIPKQKIQCNKTLASVSPKTPASSTMTNGHSARSPREEEEGEDKDGTKEKKENGEVDELVKGLKECTIEAADHGRELSEAVRKLTITDQKVAKTADGPVVTGAQKKQTPVSVPRGQPQEDDERGDKATEEEKEKEEKEKMNETKRANQLVKLKAPQAKEESSPEPTSDDLEERGPMQGVPSSQYHAQHQYIGQKNYIPSADAKMLNFQMPANFPNYGFNNFQPEMAMDGGHSGKRAMESQEMYYEPPKYTRPQDADPAYMMGNEFNNLNDPKKVSSKVYQKQMSGGTVYAPDEPAQVPQGNGEGQWERMNSFDILDGLNIPVDNDIIENLDEVLINGNAGNTDPDVHFLGAEHGSHQAVLQQTLPPVSSFTAPAIASAANQFGLSQTQPGFNLQQQPLVNQFQQQVLHQQQQQFIPRQQMVQQQQQQQQQQHYQQLKSPPSYQQMSPRTMPIEPAQPAVEDMGYSSDLSPSHEPQMSPEPCPSVASPAMSHQGGTSPPHTVYSPPPSNMSTSSHDSGVCSPMSDHDNQQEVAHSSFVDHHLVALEDALDIASKDLMHMMYNKKDSKNSKKVVTKAQQSFAQQQQQQSALPVQLPSTAATVQQSQGGMVPVIPQQRSQSSMGKTMQSAVQGDGVAVPPSAMPTTVAAALISNHDHLGTVKDSSVSQQGKVGAGLPQMAGKVPQVVYNSPRQQSHQQTAPPAPQVNKEGKIALPPIHKPKVNMVPVVVSVTSVPFIITSVNTPAKQPPRYPPIAPRDPNKQDNTTPTAALGKAKPVNGNSSPVCTVAVAEPSKENRQVKPNNGGSPPSPAENRPNGVNTTPVTQLLTLARRLVADMKRDDLTYIDNERDTYLHVAVCRADRFMVQALLERLDRENLSHMQDMQNIMGQTPLYLAVSTKHPEMVTLLINHGAKVNELAKCKLPSGAIEQAAAIHCAASRGDGYLSTLLALLKAKDINLNLVDLDGHTALHKAILCHGKNSPDPKDPKDTVVINSIPIIQALLQHGADPNLQVQKNGKTALMYALESHNLELIESTFQCVDPTKLPTYLKTQAFDKNTCLKIAENFKQKLSPECVHRLMVALKPGSHQGYTSSPMACSPPHSQQH